MIDVETLGIENTAPVFQVAACLFNTLGDDMQVFQWHLNVEEQMKAGAVIEHGSLQWWLGENPALLRNLLDPDLGLPTSMFVEGFCAMRNLLTNDNTRWWANGVLFDFPKVERLLRHDICSYYRKLDYRTMKDQFKTVPKPEMYGPKHDAFFDVQFQAIHLQRIWEHVARI